MSRKFASLGIRGSHSGFGFDFGQLLGELFEPLTCLTHAFGEICLIAFGRRKFLPKLAMLGALATTKRRHLSDFALECIEFVDHVANYKVKNQSKSRTKQMF